MFAGMLLTAFFLALEGLCSFAVVAYKMVTEPALAERRHTEYDAELGWINIPNFEGHDFYGPGRHLHTNAQRFRGTRDIPRAMPAGKVRILCSGNSFTLGYGVGDSATWCAQLERIDSRLETVNMGQGGYGVDQAYLWFERVQGDTEHGVHLLAFIADDFRRMASTSFSGYGKPVLELVNGEIRVSNTPVPRGSYRVSALIPNGHEWQQLNMVRVGRRLLFGREYVPTDQEIAETARKLSEHLFAKLHREHARHGRLFVLAFFPLRSEVHAGSSDWAEFVGEKAREHRWHFMDLAEEFRALPPHEVDKCYLGDEISFRAAAGHWNERGNRLAAESIHRRLVRIPEFVTQCETRANRPGRPNRENDPDGATTIRPAGERVPRD